MISFYARRPILSLALIAISTIGPVGALPALADPPSPLLCTRVETCRNTGDCSPLGLSRPFILRQTDGQWVIETHDSAGDVWMMLAPSRHVAETEAPDGVRVALIEAGITPGGDFVLHEHWIHPASLSEGFARHTCEAPQ